MCVCVCVHAYACVCCVHVRVCIHVCVCTTKGNRITTFPIFIKQKIKTSTLLTSFSVHLAEPVVAHLVHETVEQRWGAFLVHPELPSRCVVVVLLDVSALLSAATNSHHPQELVYVWEDAITQHTNPQNHNLYTIPSHSLHINKRKIIPFTSKVN